MPGPSLVGLTIEQKIAQDATGTPEEPVGPTFDATLVLVEHEYGARCDHLALRIHEAPSDPGYEAPTSRLKDEKGVERALNPPRPRRFCPGGRGLGAVLLVGGHGRLEMAVLTAASVENDNERIGGRPGAFGDVSHSVKQSSETKLTHRARRFAGGGRKCEKSLIRIQDPLFRSYAGVSHWYSTGSLRLDSLIRTDVSVSAVGTVSLSSQ